VRLGNYNSQPAQLLPFYAAQGKLSEVDGMQSIDSVSEQVATVLEHVRSNAVAAKKGFFARLFGR
jgi:adenylate kinase